MKFCPKCKTKKSKLDFNKNRARYDGLDSYCKSCNSIRQKQRYAKNSRKDYFSVKRSTNGWRTYMRDYKRNREYKDLSYKLRNRLRTRLFIAIRNNQKAGSAVKDLGCSIDELKLYLENQFEPGMTWDNYGEWHIDHIIPLSHFDLTDREQFLKACHYTNLQPLWGLDNISKGNK
jgi:hypothetical protein